MSATIDERKAVLNETQRTWIKKISEALQLRMADEIVLSGPADQQLAGPAGDTLASFADAPPKPGSPQPAPLSQSQTGPQAQSPTPAPGQPAKPPAPIVFTRTTKIDTSGQAKRSDKFAISGAKTPADVTKIVEGKGKDGYNGRPAAELDNFSRILKQASLMSSAPTMVPTVQETAQIREKYAKLNAALVDGKIEEAARISRDLGLPIALEQLELEEAKLPHETSNLTDKQWQTLLALGVADIDATKTTVNGKPHFSWNGPRLHPNHAPNQKLNALNGTAGFAQLVDDMAAHGVTPLNSPPDQKQMDSYLQNVRTKAERQAQIDRPGQIEAQKRAISDALLAASQRLMDGMQVHYNGAGDKDMNYGPTQMSSTFLFRDNKLVMKDGKPLKLELPAAEGENKVKINKWVDDNGGGKYYFFQTKTPEGFGDNTSQAVFGHRHESDCEGMASFRLRTLPPDFKRLGVVSGRLATGQGIGHMVAIFQSPDGRVFLSSNGKQPIPVNPSRGSTNVSGIDIRSAVVEEFDAIYRDKQTESDFTFGLATPTTLNPPDVNKSTDLMLKEASNDDTLRSNLGRPKQMPELNWNSLAP